MLTLAAVAMMFTYHPPTETSGPVHKELNEAVHHFAVVLDAIESGPELVTFDDINRAALSVAEAMGVDILNFDPHGKAGLAALALARNYANEAILRPRTRSGHDNIAFARERLNDAKYLLNGAVACHYAFVAHQQGLRELAAREAVAREEKMAGAGEDT